MTDTAITVTFKKIATGEFDVLHNGVPSGFLIINGSLGLSGRDTPNMYGFAKGSNPPKWVGTLAACKKIMMLTGRNLSKAQVAA